MMNSTRQSDNNSEAKYGYGSYTMHSNNNNMPGNGSNYYAGVNPSLGLNNHYGYPNVDKTYSVVTTEPVIISCDQPLVIVDPPMETHVKSYTTWSVFNILFCCLIGGVITTFMACKVRVLNDNQKFKEAMRLSSKVLIANMVITGVGALIWFIAFPYFYCAIYPSLPKINW